MKYGFDITGGFYAFTNTDCGYAYPTSDHAKQARKAPERVAQAMLRGHLALLRAVNPQAAKEHYGHIVAKAQA